MDVIFWKDKFYVTLWILSNLFILISCDSLWAWQDTFLTIFDPPMGVNGTWKDNEFFDNDEICDIIET